LRIIDLDGLLMQNPELCPDGPALPNLDLGGETDDEEGQGRVIRSMLFCDIAGYSKLKEEHIPDFLEFLTRLKAGLVASGIEPKSINTWGDAIFVVMDKATPMAEYALTMQEVVARLGEEMKDQLADPLTLRISLHAGPVFEAVDPIRDNKNFYGSHINRAARLEPVTVKGHVYATQQFVAVLTAEQSALRTDAVNNGEEFVDKYVCEYVGVLSLAKDFGKQTVYHLRRRVEHQNEIPAAMETVVSDVLEAADNSGITETPATSVGSVLETVARMIERSEGESPKGKGRKKKKTATAHDVLSVSDGDVPNWPGT
ncbi:MAG: adenylate/guanylate cyclase domain-containing protein, partial [Magnetospirillum sp.]|nr:adenylate/guanylate cyclase domain-containing protein [Magnetospirillum sp.]